MTKSKCLIALMIILTAGLAAACRNAETDGTAAAAPEGETRAPAGTVTLSAQAAADGGIVVVEAKMTALAERIAAPGELEFNARRLAEVSTRADGRIERALVVAGDRVAAGQVLAEIYSREYLASQAEVLQAAARVSRLGGDPEEAAAKAFLEAARRKLIPLGLEEKDVDALITTGTVRPFLAVRAPFAGTVIEAASLAGAHVQAGAPLFKLADLAGLWACVHIFEKDLAAAKAGTDAVLRTQAYPGREFRGRLVLVGAVMDDKTRTIEGRIEVPNGDGSLRVGMYVEAAIASGAERTALLVPLAALQEFQSRPVVFVKTGPTSYALRAVEVGARTAAVAEITKGLAAGELVVSAGSFLIKSELLKSSLGE
ncbi:MAG: efflux RND transporter periplasmic adaptor subunit [Candidatus Aminicenantes bacterium]|nr:efflux RND transporter periplasmic adaptor subunit [Candidatus Aminicenantes bacterium]